MGVPYLMKMFVEIFFVIELMNLVAHINPEY
jgi:hypothetical protein